VVGGPSARSAAVRSGGRSSVDAPFPRVEGVDDYFDPDRFDAEPFDGGNMSSTWTVCDRATRRRFILKCCQGGDDAEQAASEVALSRLGRLVGEPMPQTRFAAPDSQVHVISQHVEDNPDEGELLGTGLDYTDSSEDRRRLVRELAEPLQPLRIMVKDFITHNGDRHGGNFLVMSIIGRPAAKRLVPVDHAVALLGHSAGESVEVRLARLCQVDSLRAFYNVDGIAQAEGVYGDMLVLVQCTVRDGRVTREQLAGEYDRLLAVWRHAVRTVDLGDLDGRYVRRARQLMTARLAGARRSRGQTLELLCG
jgi:hypothetical protein